MLKTYKFANKNKYEFYKRWFEYIPESWNIETVLDKKASELTDQELDHLKLIKENRKSADILKKYIKMIEEKQGECSNEICELPLTSNEYAELDNVISSFDLEKMSLAKLTSSELNEINRLIDLFNGTNRQEIAKEISKIEDIYMRDYAEYLFVIKAASYTTKKFNDMMKEDYRGHKFRSRTNLEHLRKY